MSEKRDNQSDRSHGLGVSHGNAICYSGYREGQSPRDGLFPSYAQTREDLLILEKNWTLLRLYDCSPHAETVLEIISRENMKFKVMRWWRGGSNRNRAGSTQRIEVTPLRR